MNKFVCTTMLAAGLALFGTGTDEVHAGNSSFFLSVGGPRASLSYSSGYRGGYGGRGYSGKGYRGSGRDAYYGRRVPVNYGRVVLRPSYSDAYRRDSFRRSRGGYGYGYGGFGYGGGYAY